jgi:hypothetical protein
MPATIADFIAEHRLTMSTVRADGNPFMEGMPVGSSHWRCAIIAPDREPVEIYFSMGPAHTHAPELGDVLGCVASDIASVENAPDWLDWAEELGYTTAAELRRARTTHRVISEQRDAMRELLGDALETLLWDTEQL